MCPSAKDTEYLLVNKMVEDTVFVARQIETLLYGSYEGRLAIHLYTESEDMLESIEPTMHVDIKSLLMVMQDLKERLLEGEVESYQ